MKKQSEKSRFLLVTGLLLIAGTQLFTHFYLLTDVAHGVAFGIGVGFMLTAVLSSKFPLRG